MRYKIHTLEVEDIGDIFHHWHPQSQKYAGGDSLATALFIGWSLKKVVLLEKHFHARTRRVNIYHFELVRDDEFMSMPVVGNPYVERLIAELGLDVVALSRRKPIPYVADAMRSPVAEQVRVS